VIPGATAPVAGDPALCVTISPNSGAIMASDASVGVTGAAAPGSTQQNGGTDGAALRANHMFDLDSGAGAEFNLGVNLRASAPGGSVEAGTIANPLQVAAASLPLPTGAATEATLLTLLTQAQLEIELDEKFGDLGQKTMAGSAPVVIASDQSAIPITAAALPLPTGAATSANQTTLGNQTTKINDGTNTATVKAASTAAVATDTALVVAISPNNSIAVTTTPNVVGTEGNAWSAAAVLANGVSASIDCQYTPNISVFGNTSGTTKITVQFSQDNANFYDATEQNIPSGGDFSISDAWGARYIRLKSSQARTITATIAGKG
jgi:hypothetical protein